MVTDKRTIKIDHNGNMLHDPIDATNYKKIMLRGTQAPKIVGHDWIISRPLQAQQWRFKIDRKKYLNETRKAWQLAHQK